MIQKPFAAFGYVLIANYYDRGEEFNVNTYAESKTFLFCSSGDTVGKDRLTGRVIEEYKAGWSNFGVNKTQEFTNFANEASVCWCYDPKLNKDFLPKITPIIIKRGDQLSVPNLTKLFLCEGTLSIQDREFVGPYQLHIKTGDKVLYAVSDCYGLTFE
jgi:hypothetical protein